MEKQISIIIPTYNMEAYIGKCLDSLLIPELDQVEVWVINDGSKDHSSEIAHSYAKLYPDSIHVLDKSNGNYGSCINAALPLCSGRYIKILDADDTFDTKAFSEFVRELNHCCEDVIITNHKIINPNNEVLDTSSIPTGIKINTSLSIDEVANTICSSYVQMHRLSYNRSLFSKFSYFQTEGVSYTDSQWSIIPMAYCKTFRCINKNVYQYLIGREGQTMSKEQLAKFLNQFFIVLSDTINYYISYGGDPKGKAMFCKHVCDNHEYVYFNVVQNYTETSRTLLRDYDIALKTKMPEIYERLNLIQYADEINFPVMKYIRKKNYPATFSLPRLRYIELGLKVRFKKLFKIWIK